MLTIDDAKTRVARGAAFLDDVQPGWVNRIDVGTLSLAACHQCVLGQLHGDFWAGVRRQWAPTDPIASVQANGLALGLAIGHGFALCDADIAGDDLFDDASAFNRSYQTLQDAWIEAIADRRLAQAHVLAEIVPRGTSQTSAESQT